MKRFKILPVWCILAALTLTGCGDGELPWKGINAAPVEPVKLQAQEVENIENSRLEDLQQRYGTAGFTAEEYVELAGLYLAGSRNKEAREVLEGSKRTKRIKFFKVL